MGLTLFGLCGSLRGASTNRLLLNEAARHFGADSYTEGNLRLPLYDGDLEAEGIPKAVVELAAGISAADAVIIASPEYNKGLSGVLKNALDWISRTEGKPWQDKPVAIMSATAGRAGGERGLTMLTSCLAPFQPRLMFGPEVLVGQTHDQWDEAGRLTNEINEKSLIALMEKLRDAAA